MGAGVTFVFAVINFPCFFFVDGKGRHIISVNQIRPIISTKLGICDTVAVPDPAKVLSSHESVSPSSTDQIHQ